MRRIPSIRFSIFMLMCVVTLVATGLSLWQRFKPMTDFKVVVSGALASELADDMVVSIWQVSTNAKKTACYTVSDFPIWLHYEDYANSTWNVSFLDPDSLQSPLFTVELSRDLFDKPRKINITLNEPTPKLRPFMNWQRLRYTANISNRMHYRDLPFWDENGLLSPESRQDPVLTVTNETTGAVLLEEQMHIGCWGSRWFSNLTDLLNVDPGQQLRYVVNYNSGGAFETIETEFKRGRPTVHVEVHTSNKR